MVDFPSKYIKNDVNMGHFMGRLAIYLIGNPIRVHFASGVATTSDPLGRGVDFPLFSFKGGPFRLIGGGCKKNLGFYSGEIIY